MPTKGIQELDIPGSTVFQLAEGVLVRSMNPAHRRGIINDNIIRYTATRFRLHRRCGDAPAGRCFPHGRPLRLPAGYFLSPGNPVMVSANPVMTEAHD